MSMKTKANTKKKILKTASTCKRLYISLSPQRLFFHYYPLSPAANASRCCDISGTSVFLARPIPFFAYDSPHISYPLFGSFNGFKVFSFCVFKTNQFSFEFMFSPFIIGLWLRFYEHTQIHTHAYALVYIYETYTKHGTFMCLPEAPIFFVIWSICPCACVWVLMCALRKHFMLKVWIENGHNCCDIDKSDKMVWWPYNTATKWPSKFCTGLWSIYTDWESGVRENGCYLGFGEPRPPSHLPARLCLSSAFAKRYFGTNQTEARKIDRKLNQY